MRNDQLLARRQRARPLVAIGLQDRGGRNIVAARQDFERVAGADDDRGAALHRSRGSPRPNAARRCRWSRAADAPAANRRRRRARLRTRRRRRPDRTAAPRSAAATPTTDTAVLRAGILRKFAALDRGRRHRTGGFRLRGKGIGKGILREARRHVGAAAGKTDRHQRQHRDLRHAARAKQLDDTGHGYSLVRNKLLF